MLYQKPNFLTVSADFFQSYSQYELVVTQEACPHFLTKNLGFSSEGFLICGDSQDLADAISSLDKTYTLTCSNIGGSYTVILFNSEAHFGGGLSCGDGNSTVVIPLSISPDLPSDCIVDQFVFNSTDLCSPIS